MKRLNAGEYATVYHEVTPDGNHLYWFLDGGRKIYLDWGEIGHFPDADQRFPHPSRNMDLRLYDILWAEDDP